MLIRLSVILCLLALPGFAAMAQGTAPPATAPPGTAPPEETPPPAVETRPQSPSSEVPQSATPGTPQTVEQQQPGRVFCEQHVSYQLADPGSVPEQYRRYIGVWSDAAWDVKTCAALIVQDLKPDGTASIIYVSGPLGSRSTAAGAVLHGTGIIRNGALRFQNSDGSQYAFRPGIVDMTGHWIKPQGESFQATFKQTP